MEGLWLLAKINVVFQVAEKVAYGLIGLYGAYVAKRYISDYKMSVEDEKIKGSGR
jgi:uncharacterized membrane protein YuzA (DUF378 family)